MTGHIVVLDALKTRDSSLTVNLGTGRGYSVLEVVKAFEAASGRKVPYELAARRPGEVAQCFASTLAAEEILGWRAEHPNCSVIISPCSNAAAGTPVPLGIIRRPPPGHRSCSV